MTLRLNHRAPERAIHLKLSQPPSHFLGILPAIESGNPKVTFAARAETTARSNHDIQVAQHPVEHLPARHTRGCLDPDIRRVLSAEDSQSRVCRRFPQNPRVPHVMLDQLPDLRLACLGINRLRSALHRITDAIRLGAPAPLPEWVQRQ